MAGTFASNEAPSSPRCNWQHERLKTPSQWPLLPSKGSMETETDDGRPARLELANCPHCNSTLAREVVL